MQYYKKRRRQGAKAFAGLVQGLADGAWREACAPRASRHGRPSTQTLERSTRQCKRRHSEVEEGATNTDGRKADANVIDKRARGAAEARTSARQRCPSCSRALTYHKGGRQDTHQTLKCDLPGCGRTIPFWACRFSCAACDFDVCGVCGREAESEGEVGYRTRGGWANWEGEHGHETLGEGESDAARDP